MTETGILARIRSVLPTLPGSVQQTAQFILDDPHGSISGTIGDLARAADTSTGAVSRLCRTLGIDGYPALRIAVSADAAGEGAFWTTDISRDIGPTDPLSEVVRTLGVAQARAVKATMAGLDLDAIAVAADAISNAARVHVYGVSGSGVMARELELRLSRIGVPCWTFSDVHDGIVGAAQLAPGDVAIAISHSGATEETLDMVTCARDHGAQVVVITSERRSPVARVADQVLITLSEITTFRDGPLAARHSELAVVEALYVAVGQTTYDSTIHRLAATSDALQTRTSKGSPHPRNEGKPA